MKMSRRSGRLAILVGALSLIGIWPAANANAQEPAPTFNDDRCVLAGYTLKHGQDFREVVAAKDALEALGFTPREAGGSKSKFDDRMVEVVKIWEGYNTRPQDGEIDETDWIRLMSGAYGCTNLHNAGAGSDAPSARRGFPQQGVVGNVYVRNLQQQFQDMCYTIWVDGNFGTQTASVIRSFQETRGLPADGKIDLFLEEEVVLAIAEGFCATSRPTPEPEPEPEPTEGGDTEVAANENNDSIGCSDADVLQVGDNCDKVGALQNLLANFSCYARHQVDNDFGSGTQWSVREFQKVNQLNERDGRAGAETLGALNRSSSNSCGAVGSDGGAECDDETNNFGDILDHFACTITGNDDGVDLNLPSSDRERDIDNYFDLGGAIGLDFLKISRDAAVGAVDGLWDLIS